MFMLCFSFRTQKVSLGESGPTFLWMRPNFFHNHLSTKLVYPMSRADPTSFLQDYIVNAIAAKLIGIYDVSNDVLNKRISKELEKGYLSLE